MIEVRRLVGRYFPAWMTCGHMRMRSPITSPNHLARVKGTRQTKWGASSGSYQTDHMGCSIWAGTRLIADQWWRSAAPRLMGQPLPDLGWLRSEITARFRVRSGGSRIGAANHMVPVDIAKRRKQGGGIADPHFFQQARPVHLHRAITQAEAAGDFLAGFALAKQGVNFPFTPGQRLIRA